MDSNKKMKVLLVDDENICHMSVKSFSKKLDVDLDSAKNGHEAFEKVKSNNYNLILMDMIMPEMDGREATQLMRGLSNGKSFNIVGMSAGNFLNFNSKIFLIFRCNRRTRTKIDWTV